MPLLWISFSFIGGLILGAYFPWDGWLVLALTILLVGLIGLKVSQANPSLTWLRFLIHVHPTLRLPPVLLFAALAFGACRYQSALPDLATQGQVAVLNGQGTYQITATITQPPDRRDTVTILQVTVEQAVLINADDHPGEPFEIGGQMLVMLRGRPEWQYGDRLLFTGEPATPPGTSPNDDFSYRDYLAHQQIYSYLLFPRTRLVKHDAGIPALAAVYQLRERAYEKIYQIFPASEAPLLAGILLGIESDLTPTLKSAFQSTGTAHIIAISGFNIAILAGLFSNLAAGLFGRFLSRWWVLVIVVCTIAFYTLMVGASPSVVRAAIMGSLGLLAAQLGRRSVGWAGLNTLTFTAAVMCLFNPFLPWDASFQLSFTATLGLMLYAAPLQEGFARLAATRLPETLAKKVSQPVGEYVLFTLAAQFVTLPVILYHFQRVSFTSLLANPLILPVQPPLMILSGLAVITSLMWDAPARLLAAVALPFSMYTIRVVEWFSNFSNGSVPIGPLSAGSAVVLSIVVVAPALTTGMIRQLPEKIKEKFKPSLLLIGVGLIVILAFQMIVAQPDGRLHLILFDQDGEPVLLIETPGGNRVLINTGESANSLSQSVGRYLSPFDHRLDAILVTTCQESNLRTLPVTLRRFPTRNIWWGCKIPGGSGGREALEAIEDARTITARIRAGQQIRLDTDLTVQVNATDDEKTGIAIVWKDFRLFMPSGLPTTTSDIPTPNVLILSEADLETTAPEVWQSLAPQMTIITAQSDPNRPLPVEWVGTRRWGWLSIDTDGKTMWIQKSP